MELKTTDPTGLQATRTSIEDLDIKHAIADALDASEEPEGPTTERFLAIEFLWHTAAGVQPVILIARHRLQ